MENPRPPYLVRCFFGMAAACRYVSRHLDDVRARMQEEGYDEGDIQLAQGGYLEGLSTTVRGHVDTLRSVNVGVENERRDIVLAQMLSETFVRAHATVEDPVGGLVHLLELAAGGSEIHKSMVVSFRGVAADYVLSLITQHVGALLIYHSAISLLMRLHILGCKRISRKPFNTALESPST